jgi:hypothetical protein
MDKIWSALLWFSDKVDELANHKPPKDIVAAQMRIACIGIDEKTQKSIEEDVQHQHFELIGYWKAAGEEEWKLQFRDISPPGPSPDSKVVTPLSFFQSHIGHLKEIEKVIKRGPRSVVITKAGGGATGIYDGFMIRIPDTDNNHSWFDFGLEMADALLVDGEQAEVTNAADLATINRPMEDGYRKVNQKTLMAGFVCSLLRRHQKLGWGGRWWILDTGDTDAEEDRVDTHGSNATRNRYYTQLFGEAWVPSTADPGVLGAKIAKVHREQHIRQMTAFFGPELAEKFNGGNEPDAQRFKRANAAKGAIKEGYKVDPRPTRTIEPFVIPLIMSFTMGKFRA